MLSIYVVMISYKIDSYKGTERFLRNHPQIAWACGLEDQIPSYRTLSRRLSTIEQPAKSAVYQLLKVLVEHGVISLHTVATDSSLLAAQGKPAQKKDPSVKPTDPDASWGWSKTRGWVFGYKLHLTSTVDCNGEIVPLAWEVTTGSVHDSLPFSRLMDEILDQAAYCGKTPYWSLADKGYDSNDHYERLDSEGVFLYTPVRRFKGKKCRHPLRRRALDLNESPSGKRWYYRRGDVERLYGQLKSVYALDPLPLIGINQVKGYCAVASVAYLAGVLYNHLNGRSKRAIKSLTF